MFEFSFLAHFCIVKCYKERTQCEMFCIFPVYCVTPACITVASMLINSIDTTVDPCEDFYTYACGGWINSHVIPSGEARWGSFSEIWKYNQEVMKRVIGKDSWSGFHAFGV